MCIGLASGPANAAAVNDDSSVTIGLFIAEVDASQQELLASSEALLSQGARQALAGATVMTSAEVSAMRSTLQVLASHLTALQVAAKLPSKQGEVVFQ